jgi:hypothetical protein
VEYLHFTNERSEPINGYRLSLEVFEVIDITSVADVSVYREKELSSARNKRSPFKKKQVALALTRVF